MQIISQKSLLMFASYVVVRPLFFPFQLGGMTIRTMMLQCLSANYGVTHFFACVSINNSQRYVVMMCPIKCHRNVIGHVAESLHQLADVYSERELSECELLCPPCARGEQEPVRLVHQHLALQSHNIKLYNRRVRARWVWAGKDDASKYVRTGFPTVSCAFLPPRNNERQF